MMVDRLMMVDDGFMMMIGLRIVSLVFLIMAVSLAKEKISQKTQKPWISLTILRPDPRNFLIQIESPAIRACHHQHEEAAECLH